MSFAAFKLHYVCIYIWAALLYEYWYLRLKRHTLVDHYFIYDIFTLSQTTAHLSTVKDAEENYTGFIYNRYECLDGRL